MSIVGFFLGWFLYISKCLNYTHLLAFISLILHDVFLMMPIRKKSLLIPVSLSK